MTGKGAADQSETDRSEQILESIRNQIEDLCYIHEHMTRVLINLDIDEDWFSGYDEQERAKYDFKAMILTLVYMRARNIGQSEMERRLHGVASLGVRFGFDNIPDQQAISYNQKNRFDNDERVLLKKIADELVETCIEHDIMHDTEPKIELDKIDHEQVEEQEIMDVVEQATEIGFQEFSADRGSNTSYPLDAFFERQGYINLAKAGTTTKSRRFARLSNRKDVPHGSTHNRTMKKVADPDAQVTFAEFRDGVTPEWKRIRDEILEPFHAGVEAILKELTSGEGAESAIREPVHAAIDITVWPYHVSPYWSNRTASNKDKNPIELDIDGETKLIDPDYPELVSGTKDGERGFKMATITIVAQDTPIVLGVEPVRDSRKFEKELGIDIDSPPRGETVDRLIEQAKQHVDLHKIFLDRGFDSDQTRAIIDQHESLYVLGKSARADIDKEHIEEIKDDDYYDSRLVHGTLEYDGTEHDITYIYKESDTVDKKYVMFTVNEHIDHHRAEGLISQYGQRMEIENQYKSIKKHFLPTCASKDYRIRLLYFVIGVVLYNVWRLANYLLRDVVDFHLGESPPIPAGELIEIVGICMSKPPD
ncbi:transposase [Halonotius terrestris]|uniref:Transposase n=1 Tax=Halonotius terrestris TaxID=2487750 RepID=A0A8J8TDG1_9EURY|nr:transposase [Halonotius terrestris]TQQ83041.1 transposase [Halonotius terrestris]